ncbi:MAG: UPF0758 domain-containing protein [Pseudomonadota bacterium]
MKTGLTSLQQLPTEARPGEKLLARGAGALAEPELLALLLRTGLPGQGVLQPAQALLDRFGSLAGLLHADATALALNAAAVVLAHNDPSGAAEPSRADEAVTRAVRADLQLVAVRELDHLRRARVAVT